MKSRRVLLIADVEGWAYDIIAKSIANRFRKYIAEIVYFRDLIDRKVEVNTDEYDVIFAFFWYDMFLRGNLLGKMDSSKVCVDVQSHNSWLKRNIKVSEVEKILKNNGFVFNSKQPSTSNQPSNVILKLWGTGKPLREFLHVDDLAEACILLMKEYDSDELIKENISHLNIGSSEEVSIYDLAKSIKEVVGFKGLLEFDKQRLDGTPRKLLDSTRLNLKGWKRKISLEEGLYSSYDWFRKNFT